MTDAEVSGPLRDAPQLGLFSADQAKHDWQDEWKGMPEFIMGDTRPIHQLTVNFANYDDLKAFAAAIGQKLTRKTDSVWFPRRPAVIPNSELRYVEES